MRLRPCWRLRLRGLRRRTQSRGLDFAGLPRLPWVLLLADWRSTVPTNSCLTRTHRRQRLLRRLQVRQ
ncbi:hypothetical protein JG688_00018716 [Phytophthora aleatoria]|uniref:Uncharacterized protein n=1 Tax=Phytophthora aleatoria TaxID=2496075 RepID=A0A8J5MBA5_9STRA|nr:hypothetical protein JG688_00018716 [Phytophthora aleatoria]